MTHLDSLSKLGECGSTFVGGCGSTWLPGGVDHETYFSTDLPLATFVLVTQEMGLQALVGHVPGNPIHHLFIDNVVVAAHHLPLPPMLQPRDG